MWASQMPNFTFFLFAHKCDARRRGAQHLLAGYRGRYLPEGLQTTVGVWGWWGIV